MISPICGIQKIKVSEAESITVAVRGWGGEGNAEMLVGRCKFSVIRCICSRDLMYTMVTMVNKTIIYLKFAKTVDFKCSHHLKKR